MVLRRVHQKSWSRNFSIWEKSFGEKPFGEKSLCPFTYIPICRVCPWVKLASLLTHYLEQGSRLKVHQKYTFWNPAAYLDENFRHRNILLKNNYSKKPEFFIEDHSRTNFMSRGDSVEIEIIPTRWHYLENNRFCLPPTTYTSTTYSSTTYPSLIKLI